jgi:hypothetical protein
VYGENYRRFPMEHRVAQNGLGKTAEYGWRVGDRSCRLFVHAGDEPGYPREGSLEQFITEHYWGYSKQRSGGSLEYRVAHAPWRVAVAASSGFEGDTTTYGTAFAEILRGKLDSAFLAEGSSVEVFAGERIGWVKRSAIRMWRVCWKMDSLWRRMRFLFSMGAFLGKGSYAAWIWAQRFAICRGSDIRVLKVDGGLECGADAYLFVAKHIWWAKPLAIRPTGVQLGVVAWVSLVRPESLSRFAVLLVAREESLTVAKEKF